MNEEFSVKREYVPLQVRFGNNPVTGEIDGWRVLAICILLNRTFRGQVEKVLPQFFEAFPFALYAEVASYSPFTHELMETILTPLGLAHTRTQRIAFMSKEWLDHEDWRKPLRIHLFAGCGQYAVDAWRIFVEKDYSKWSDDHVLQAWQMAQAGETCPTCGVPGPTHADEVGCTNALIAYHDAR